MNAPHSYNTSKQTDNDPLNLLFDTSKPIPTIIQGISGRIGRRHTTLMRDYGTHIVAGVIAANSTRSEQELDGVPLFRSCSDAVKATGAVASVVFVGPFDVLPAIQDAVNGGIKLIVTVTEGMPVADAARARALVDAAGIRWIGASTPGLAAPGRYKLGFLPSTSLQPGVLGVMAKSGTLSYEANYRLVQAGLGQSLWVGVGGDAIKGTRFAELLPFFLADEKTQGIVLIGEIGGNEEEEFAAAVLAQSSSKPVFALVAGQGARDGVVMGHAGAVVQGASGTFASKKKALESAGVRVFDTIEAMTAAVTTYDWK